MDIYVYFNYTYGPSIHTLSMQICINLFTFLHYTRNLIYVVHLCILLSMLNGPTMYILYIYSMSWFIYAYFIYLKGHLCIIYLYIPMVQQFILYLYQMVHLYSMHTLSIPMVHLCIPYLYLWSSYVYFMYTYGPSMYILSIPMVHLCILGCGTFFQNSDSKSIL